MFVDVGVDAVDRHVCQLLGCGACAGRHDHNYMHVCIDVDTHIHTNIYSHISIHMSMHMSSLMSDNVVHI